MSLLGPSKLNDGQLKAFGLSLTVMLLILGGLAQWKWQSPILATLFLSTGVIGGAIYFLTPKIRPGVYRGFMVLTFPIQWVMTILILGLVFYGLFLPIGFLFRVCGKGIRGDRKTSGWHGRNEPNEPKRYFDAY